MYFVININVFIEASKDKSQIYVVDHGEQAASGVRVLFFTHEMIRRGT